MKVDIEWEADTVKGTMGIEGPRVLVAEKLFDIIGMEGFEKVTVTVIKDGGQHGTDEQSRERKDGA